MLPGDPFHFFDKYTFLCLKWPIGRIVLCGITLSKSLLLLLALSWTLCLIELNFHSADKQFGTLGFQELSLWEFNWMNSSTLVILPNWRVVFYGYETDSSFQNSHLFRVWPNFVKCCRYLCMSFRTSLNFLDFCGLSLTMFYQLFVRKLAKLSFRPQVILGFDFEFLIS